MNSSDTEATLTSEFIQR